MSNSSILLCASSPARSGPGSDSNEDSASLKTKNKTKIHRVTTKTTVQAYAKYFKDNKILPIPKFVEAVEPKTVFHGHRLTDQETR